MSILWTNESAAKATGGQSHGAAWQAARVEIDSRKIQPGDLFVALVGERVDGHDYVKQAFEKGAVAALVSRIPEGCEHKNLLVVKDTLEALVVLGKDARSRTGATIIGVTGSVGKTSTKEMLRLMLSAFGETYATGGNYNNHIGTPLTLANLPMSAKFAVMEMGMNHAGEISYLTRMVRPHLAIISNVEAVHLEFFKDVQGIADAKAEIFDGLVSSSPNRVEVGRGASPGNTEDAVHGSPHPATRSSVAPPPTGEGVAVLNLDNPYGEYLVKKAAPHRVLTFGEKAAADARLLAYAPSEEGAEITGEIAGQTLSFVLGATGKHFALTAMSALAVAHALSLKLPKAASTLRDYQEASGRGKVVAIGDAWLIDDAYNASPASMRAAIAKTDEIWKQKGSKGRKLAALGEMRELGATGPELHAGLAESLQAHGFDLVFTACPLMQHLQQALPERMRGAHADSAKDLLPAVKSALKPGDVLLVKGSHGSLIYELAASLSAK